MLFQVGAGEIPYLVSKHPIDLIIFAAAEIQPKTVYPTIAKFYAPLWDSINLSPAEISGTVKLVDIASNLASKYILNGKTVISSCAAGLNRSGIVSAYTIEKCSSAPKNTIIDSIRKHRSPAALSNDLFVTLFLAR
jgi:protein-tyrosine phosphatase